MDECLSSALASQRSGSADFAPPPSNVAGTFDVPPKEEKIPRPNYALIYIRASMGEQNKEYLMLVRPKPECNEGEGGRYHGRSPVELHFHRVPKQRRNRT